MSATVTQTGRVATVTVSTARYIHPNHSGDVTSVGDGATTITDKAVTLGKIQDIGHGKIIGRHTAGDGTPQEIGIDGGLEIHGSNIRRAALTGDVTASAGSNATAIADDTVTNAKLANVPTATIKGRATAGTGDPEDLTAAQTRTILGLGTAALADADDLVSRAGGIFIPPTSNPYIPGSLWNNSGTPTISTGIQLFAIAGDSITDQNSAGDRFNSGGYASWLRYLTECPFTFVPRNTSAYSAAPDFDFGYGSYSAENFLNGNRSGDGVYPMTDISTADPDVLFVCLGSNSGASDITNILTIWDTFIAAGRFVIGSEILPRRIGSFGYTSGDLATCYANNATLKAAAAARGMLFAEWAHTVCETPGADASLLYTADGVHPNMQGAYRMGDYLRTFLAPYLPPAFTVPTDGSASWVTSNPYMAGDVSGGATGFTFTGHTAKSKVTDGDGTVWQRITSSQAFNAIDTLRQSAGTTTAVPGDIVRGVCRVRPVASGWDITSLQLYLYSTVSGSTTIVERDMSTTTQTSGILFNPSAGLLMTPAYTVPSGTTGLWTYLNNHGSGTMDVRQLGVIKVG